MSPAVTMSTSMPTYGPSPRRRLLAAAAFALAATLGATATSPVWAQGPKQNLWVELRWVDQELSAAAVGGLRDGGTVVSTGGSVSTRGGVTLSTENRARRQQQLPRVMVLNGAQASITLSEATPVQWVDVAVDRQQGAQDRVIVVPRQGVVERVRSFSVKPSWPGGRGPVTVEVRAQDLAPTPPPGAQIPGADGDAPRDSAAVLSTVQAPVGVWVTIARTGGAVTPSPRGTYSTRDAEVQQLRELQLRVDVAP